jgi:hypothetical protein
VPQRPAPRQPSVQIASRATSPDDFNPFGPSNPSNPSDTSDTSVFAMTTLRPGTTIEPLPQQRQRSKLPDLVEIDGKQIAALACTQIELFR